MYPLAIVAGALLKDHARSSTIAAQSKARDEENARQDVYRGQVSAELQKNIDANTQDRRLKLNNSEADRVRGQTDVAQKNAGGLFEGAGGDQGVLRSALDAAGKRSASGAALAAPGMGARVRNRDAADVNSNIAGIRQKSQRSLGLLPQALDVAAVKGESFNTVGGLLESYGYGGTAQSLSSYAQSSGKKKQAPPVESNEDYYGAPRYYNEGSAGASDLWGDNAASGQV